MKNNLTKTFLTGAIILFIISGVFGAMYFLFSNIFGWVGLKILLTTITLFVACLLGLGSSKMSSEKGSINFVLGKLNYVLLLYLTGYVLVQVWLEPGNNDTLLQFSLVLGIISVAITHYSLLSGKINSKITKVSLYTTITLMIIVVLMLSYLVMSVIGSYNVDDTFYKLLGFFAVLDVTATIVTVLLKKVKG